MSRKDTAKAKVGQQRRTSSELPKAGGVDLLTQQIRYLPGGRETFVGLVQLASDGGDASAQAWWRVYSALPKTHQKACSLYDVTIAAGVRLSALWAGIVGHAVEFTEDSARMIAAVLHPQLVAKAGESALRISGPHAQVAADDRRQMMQALGSLPMPRNAGMQVTVNANANAAAASASEPSVPKFADDLAALPEASRGFLPAPTGPTKVIDVEAVRELVKR
jgi:hypothetical protein